MDTRRGFHDELDAIRSDLVRLAALVCEAIPRGTQILLDGDRAGDAQALLLATGQAHAWRPQPILDLVPQPGADE